MSAHKFVAVTDDLEEVYGGYCPALGESVVCLAADYESLAQQIDELRMRANLAEQEVERLRAEVEFYKPAYVLQEVRSGRAACPASMLSFPVMVTCSICGNKRCPKAQSPFFKCTNSNESDQVGELESSGTPGEKS